MQPLHVMLYNESLRLQVYTSHFAYLSHPCSEWLSLWSLILWKSYPFWPRLWNCCQKPSAPGAVSEAAVLCVSWSQLGTTFIFTGKMAMGKRESTPDQDIFKLPGAWHIGLWHFPQLDTVQPPVPARRGSSGCRWAQLGMPTDIQQTFCFLQRFARLRLMKNQLHNTQSLWVHESSPC